MKLFSGGGAGRGGVGGDGGRERRHIAIGLSSFLALNAAAFAITLGLYSGSREWIATTARRMTGSAAAARPGAPFERVARAMAASGGWGADGAAARRRVQAADAATQYEGEKLVFSDDFDRFDLSVWKHELTAWGGGNQEHQWYVNNRSVTYTRDGVLYIKPGLTSSLVGEEAMLGGNTVMDIRGADPPSLCTAGQFDGCMKVALGGDAILPPIISGRISTQESFAFKYGRVEVRARMPRGDWLWPAVWLLPRHAAYGPWPASGEIDLLESRGNDATYPLGGRDTFGSTLHWGADWKTNAWHLTHKTYKGPDLTEGYHTYGVVWAPGRLYTYIDVDDNAHRVLDVDMSAPAGMWAKAAAEGGLEGRANPWAGAGPNAPFDTHFYLILNVAVGGSGSYFPAGMGGRPWGSFRDFWTAKDDWYASWGNGAESSALAVDWIRVWQAGEVEGASVWPATRGLPGTRGFSVGGEAAGGSSTAAPAAAQAPALAGNATSGRLLQRQPVGSVLGTVPSPWLRVARPDACYVDVQVVMDLLGPCAGVELTTRRDAGTGEEVVVVHRGGSGGDGDGGGARGGGGDSDRR